MRLVIALGGNAVLKRGERADLDTQRRRLREAVAALATAGALRAAVLLTSLLCACDGDRATGPPAPIPSRASGATPGLSTGPTQIVLVSADPVPGSTVAGCGAGASGCAGRIRMAFRLTATGTGSVLWCAGFLHAADKTACLQGRTGGLALRAGEAQTFELIFDLQAASDRCRTPLEITDLALSVEGTVEVASRQEWALRYHLAP
jgi:hypothetical protein